MSAVMAIQMKMTRAKKIRIVQKMSRRMDSWKQR